MENKLKQIKGNKYFWCGVTAGLFISILLLGGVYIGSRISRSAAVQSSNPTNGKESESSVVNKETMRKMKTLQEVIGQYYMESAESDQLQEGAYHGMVEALGDPYSTYYSSEELKGIQEKTQGIYYGIGAYIGFDKEMGMARISKVMEDSPAQESGMLGGDYIYMVEDVIVKGEALEDVISKVKGPEGTKVKLTILRENETEPVEITVERRKIESPTVNHTSYGDGISYIQITEFDEVTLDQFKDALAVEKGNGMKGLILDLRDNLGGNLLTVTEIARMLLPKGMIVYTEDKYGERSEYTSDGKNELKMPLVVLVNGNSASASEILAGAIKDHNKGTLLGTTTYGKGIVQRIISLEDGSAVKLTVSSYFTPNGNDIHKVGIEPDEELELDVEKLFKKGVDNQLERAKEIIGSQIK